MRLVSLTRATTLAVSAAVAAIGCSGDAMLYDPEPHRAHIESIESILQKPESEPGDGAKIMEHAAQLAGAVGQTIDNHRAKETIKSLLIDFGQTLADMEASGGQIDLPDARERWKLLRDGLFKQADWYI